MPWDVAAPSAHALFTSLSKLAGWHCRYDNQILQLIVSSLYLAAAASALFTAHWARKLGRKVETTSFSNLSGCGNQSGALLQRVAHKLTMCTVMKL